MTIGRLEKSLPLGATKVTLGDVVAEHGGDQHALQQAEWPPAPSAEELRRVLQQREHELEQVRATLEHMRRESALYRDELIALQDDLDVRRADAERSGYAAGLEQSEALTQAQLRELGAHWREGLEQLAQQHDDYCQQLTAQLSDLAMAAVTKILGEQLATKEAIDNGIDHIVRTSGELGALKIRVAPRHYEELMALDTLQIGVLRGQAVEMLPDSRVEYGGCLLETAGGVVDGRYEVQLTKLREIVQAG